MEEEESIYSLYPRKGDEYDEDDDEYNYNPNFGHNQNKESENRINRPAVSYEEEEEIIVGNTDEQDELGETVDDSQLELPAATPSSPPPSQKKSKSKTKTKAKAKSKRKIVDEIEEDTPRKTRKTKSKTKSKAKSKRSRKSKDPIEEEEEIIEEENEDDQQSSRIARNKRPKVDLPTLPDGSIDFSRATMKDIIRANEKYLKPTKAQAEREKAAEKRKKLRGKKEEDAEADQEQENSNENSESVGAITEDMEGEETIINRPEETEEVVEEEAEETSAPTKKSAGYAPQVRIINGQIVIDEESMTVHQDEGGGVGTHDYNVVFESSQYINSNSFSKRKPTERWSKDETNKFYRALQMYGSDFTLIAKLFPNRTRAQIRNKFKKEEKDNPKKIDHVLLNTIPPDMDEIRTAVKAAIEKEKAEKGEVEEEEVPEEATEAPLETVEETTEDLLAPIFEENTETVEEPLETVVEEEPELVLEGVEENQIVDEPKESRMSFSNYDNLGLYDDDEEVVGTIE